ncbi:hypothetical protein [uncultured Dokdonia sp.]|uniref:hypothetical protein n=1 Tax=uncultured Dokdonia sp. TaxID=575653 RepID=UPI002610731E|nr:hypothetical protein [uncultured Dokdonia sp.]
MKRYMKGAHFKLLILLLIPFFSNAQVGIGTISPNGMLTVDASSGTTAALELVAQPTPTTSLANGQLAVIGNMLYMYDGSRSKWLSIESTAIQYARDGSSDDNQLLYGGDLTSGVSGSLMPLDGTIVAIAAMGSAGDDTDINIRARDATNTNSINETITLSSLRYIDNAVNLDFNAGDFITARARDASTTTTNLSLVIWVKWRQ